MKPMTRSSLVLLLLGFLWAGPASAQQVNFQFAPPPIPYPFFEPNRADFRLTGGYFTLTGQGINLKGGGALASGRKAFNERIALDGQMGFIGVGGTVPGFSLPSLQGVLLWSPVNEGDGKLSGIALPMSMNVEFQPVRHPRGSLIVFAGPNLMIAPLTIRTPYHLVRGGTVAKSSTFETKATVVLGGIQAGVQGAIPLKKFQLTPYAMINSESGSATFNFDTGYNTYIPVKDTVVNIEPFSFSTVGGDLLYTPWNLSFGTLFQAASGKKHQSSYKLVLYTLSWHFRKP